MLRAKFKNQFETILDDLLLLPKLSHKVIRPRLSSIYLGILDSKDMDTRQIM